MFTLTYRDREEEFEDLEVKDIKDRFEIPDRKNLYRINREGELERISDKNIKDRVRNNDKLEALSDFTLGR